MGDRYINQDATRAQDDLMNAAKHADTVAKVVDTKHDNLHSALQQSHQELGDKHDTFEGEIRGNVDQIFTELAQNESDKTTRHVKTLGEAKEFTTEAKNELNLKREGLEKMHQALRTDHGNLEGVVKTDTNNLGTTQAFILNRFGMKKKWDKDCEVFGKWASADGVDHRERRVPLGRQCPGAARMELTKHPSAGGSPQPLSLSPPPSVPSRAAAS